jgi:hypothetical protein
MVNRPLLENVGYVSKRGIERNQCPMSSDNEKKSTNAMTGTQLLMNSVDSDKKNKKKYKTTILRPISSPNLGGRPGHCSLKRAAG